MTDVFDKRTKQSEKLNPKAEAKDFSFYYGNKSVISIKYSTLDIQSHVPRTGILVGSAVERSTMGGQSWVRAPLRVLNFFYKIIYNNLWNSVNTFK